MSKKYVITLDQGTTSSRAIIFDNNGRIINIESKEFKQIYPKSGWVEHNPEEIWNSQKEVLVDVVNKSDINIKDILSIGIANQRETVILWDKKTGKPVYNAIVWQCKRTAEVCDRLRCSGVQNKVKEKTGLLLDAYFSATKIQWILNNVPGVRKEAEKGNIYAGTVDTWLIWNLTKGEKHVTDYTNASRTMLFNINTLKWDEELLTLFDIPANMLPDVYPSSYIFGCIDASILGREVPIAAVMGDQQAALFGQICFEEGTAKTTYGTGCFLLMNTGKKAVVSDNLLTTVAWGIQKEVNYALEGSIFIGGAVIQWLRDGINIIDNARQCDEYAESVENTNGVYFVPAFVGMGTPYWDMYARGAIFGLTRGVNRQHIARAALEGIAYQVKDVLECMKKESVCELKSLKVDGGASVSNVMMRFQADILRTNVHRPKVVETTALGAAYMAGLKTGLWSSKEEITKIWSEDKTFYPKMDEQKSYKLYKEWKKAVQRSLNWLD